ncbi:MAG: two-component system LytT family response regulator [Salibacteraceae bacterium]|jgi:two-component system LytT family response regulator
MIKAIIVDDEKPARELVNNLVNRYFDNQIQLVTNCSSVREAEDAISRYQPNLVFLDVTMPGNSGFDLLKRISNRSFEVIIASAIIVK